jgi:hypothetical protein
MKKHKQSETAYDLLPILLGERKDLPGADSASSQHPRGRLACRDAPNRGARTVLCQHGERASCKLVLAN